MFSFNEKNTLKVFLLILAVVCLFVFWKFIILEQLYLFRDIGTDTLNISYPQFMLISRYLREVGIPFWSFSQGIGQNIFPFSLGDPFNNILFILGENYLHFGIIYVELIKIIIGGLFFYHFLRMIDVHGVARIIGGISFSFSSYMILGGSWYQFSTEAVYAAFLLWAYEKYFQENKWYWIPVPFALIAGYQPFNLFFYGIFIGCYAIFRTFRKLTIWELLNHFFKLTGYSLLGAAVMGVMLLPNLSQYWHSSRVTGTASMMDYFSSQPIFKLIDSFQFISVISRFFSNDMLYSGISYTGWENYLESPMWYSGLISLIFAPQLFSVKENRLPIVIVIFFLIVPIVFPYFRYAVWLFSGDYYRTYSFLVSIVVIIASSISLENMILKGFYSLRVFKITFLILIIMFIMVIKNSEVNIFIPCAVLIVVYLTAYGLILMIRRRMNVQLWSMALLVIFIMEELAFTNITVNSRESLDRQQFAMRLDYNDYTSETIDAIREKDPSFFRVFKYYFSSPALASLNDGKVQNFYGFSSYHSFNQPGYVRFLSKMKFIDSSNPACSIWITGPYNYPRTLSLLSQKYSLYLHNFDGKRPVFYEKIFSYHNIEVYRNPACLPLGFTYERWMTENELSSKNTTGKENALLKACVISESDIESFSHFDMPTMGLPLTGQSDTDFTSEIELLRKDTLAVSSFSENRISGAISLDKPKILFFSIPFDTGWNAYVDGIQSSIYQVNYGFIGIPLTAGEHTIVLSYFPPFLISGIILTCVALIIFLILVLHRYFFVKNDGGFQIKKHLT